MTILERSLFIFVMVAVTLAVVGTTSGKTKIPIGPHIPKIENANHDAKDKFRIELISYPPKFACGTNWPWRGRFAVANPRLQRSA
jgi:hypothetical protein